MNARKLLATLSALILVAAGAIFAQDKETEDPARSAQKTQSEPQNKTAAKKKGTTGKIEKVQRTAREWGKILTREQFRVLRRKGTERPFENKYDKHFEPGTYACAACGLELFSSTTKFNSGCGWPAFYAAAAGDHVILKPDYSHNMIRTEVVCARCESHLGHIFRDAPKTPTGNRFCINSVSLKFIPEKAQKTVKAKETDGKKSRTSKKVQKH